MGRRTATEEGGGIDTDGDKDKRVLSVAAVNVEGSNDARTCVVLGKQCWHLTIGGWVNREGGGGGDQTMGGEEDNIAAIVLDFQGRGRPDDPPQRHQHSRQ